jgi:uncharacterized protein (TIGR03032 family)
MQQPLPPFSLSCTPNVPELLTQLRCTLAVSTYQAGKVIMISARDTENLVQLPRTFNKAMGIALAGTKMAVATKDEVLVLGNSPELASHYPRQPATYDALYMPRATYYTGQIDIHDLDYGADGSLYAINTSFSCLIKINDDFSFTPVWQPSFISKLASEDRCHLNGLAMRQGVPGYVTAFGMGDTPQSWRETVTTGGIVMDVGSGEIVLRDVPMPHSPRLYGEDLLLLLSATGELARANVQTGRYEVIIRLKGFVRGMARRGDYLFIGLSRLRQNSSTFAKLPIANDARQAGIAIVHLPTGALVGNIRYHTSVDEIYDVQVLPDLMRPGILNTLRPEHKLGLATPDATYWARPEENMAP